MPKVLKLVRGAENIAGVAALGREFKVIQGIVQCTEAEAEVIAPELRDHGFAFQVVDNGVQAPAAKTPLVSGAQLSGSTAAEEHEGGYAIKDGELVIKDGLTEAEFAAFNALSDEEKANHVANLRKVSEGGPNNETFRPAGTPAPVEMLEAVKKGRTFAIVRGDVEAHKGLTEAEAATFNSLSQPEREEMLKKALAAKLGS